MFKRMNQKIQRKRKKKSFPHLAHARFWPKRPTSAPFLSLPLSLSARPHTSAPSLSSPSRLRQELFAAMLPSSSRLHSIPCQM